MNTWFALETKGRTVPHIYLSKTSKDMEIFIPYTEGRRSELRELIGAGAHLDFSKATKRWYIKRHYLNIISNALADEFGRCDVTVDSNKRETCTESCQRANTSTVYECVCVCGGTSHGGGWPKNWKAVAGGELLVSNETVRKDYTVTANGYSYVRVIEAKVQGPKVVDLPDDWEPLNETSNGLSW